MATDIELAEEYARLCDGLILTGSAMYMPSPEYAAQAKAIEKQNVTRRMHNCFTLFKRPESRSWASAEGSRTSMCFWVVPWLKSSN